MLPGKSCWDGCIRLSTTATNVQQFQPNVGHDAESDEQSNASAADAGFAAIPNATTESARIQYDDAISGSTNVANVWSNESRD